MRRLNLKAIFLIALISMIIVGVFLFISFQLYENSMNEVLNKNELNEQYYLVSETDLKDANFTTTSELHQIKDIKNAQSSFIESRIPLMTIGLITVVIIIALIFWYISRYSYYREIRKVIGQLENVSAGELTYDGDPILKEALIEVKDKFERNLEDYKRLHSYLSHEQKNMLSILRANSELLDNKESLGWIDDLSSNIDNLLALSDTKVNNDLYEVDTILVVASACDQFRKMYLDISFEFDEDDDVTIMGKERWLYRAISNLVDNAIKYGNVKPIHVKVYSKNDFVIVVVKDEGVGMSEEDKEKVFDTYYRINELKSDGYGIGLSIVSHVCELCNGSVWVESELNRGTTFYLSFPRATSVSSIE